ncbi:23S rRNA (uracil-5-)-methyltransferase RumA [Perkinsela sp. CCAP 1560/4]|nr:23S rRNA (uracil-5-)-methyltransferase RumA [Perkinsela sp. CCAP 1560/4]|eukprot:KNH09557.1 23S rRNA (uracil-5-)-methyltransferase RumA [Perkinsela sp. CCAP 1560/4]
MRPIITDLQPLLDDLIGADTAKNEKALRCFSDLFQKMRSEQSELEMRLAFRTCIPHVTQAFERVIRRLQKIPSIDVHYLVYENIQLLSDLIGPLHAKGLFQTMEKSHSLEFAREQYEKLKANDAHRMQYLQALRTLFHVALPFADISKGTVDLILDGVPSPESLHWMHVMLANQLPQVNDMISRLCLFTESTQLRALPADQQAAIKELLHTTSIVLYGRPSAASNEDQSESPNSSDSQENGVESDTHLQYSGDEEIPNIVLNEEEE